MILGEDRLSELGTRSNRSGVSDTCRQRGTAFNSEASLWVSRQPSERFGVVLLSQQTKGRGQKMPACLNP